MAGIILAATEVALRETLPADPTTNPQELASRIKIWGQDLGFAEVGFSDIELGAAEARLRQWLERGYHGDMDYMARHGDMRARPD